MKRVDAMAAAFLMVGSSRSTAVPLDDFQARSRRFLRRGLLLSGALHLTLLAAVLWMASRGDEGIVRLIEGRVVVTPDVPNVRTPPPAEPAAPPSEPAHKEGGPFEPVITRPEIDVPSNPVVGADPRTKTGDAPRELPGTDPGPPRVTDPDQVFKPNEVDKLPVEIFAPKPRYPDFELQAGITGRVVMKVLVDEEGAVRRVERLSGNKPFVDAAKETLYRWRFKPALVGGKPVRVWVEIPVNFVL
jgi:periplasmic protein TonB